MTSISGTELWNLVRTVDEIRKRAPEWAKTRLDAVTESLVSIIGTLDAEYRDYVLEDEREYPAQEEAAEESEEKDD